jgi:diguanylate cyclase (GGDEF)-like protein/PAS domain S-box-containing protein
VGLTWFHAVVIALVGPFLGYRWELSLSALFHDGTVLHTVAEGLVVASFAVLAGHSGLSRRWRATAIGFGLMSSSAILVHLSGGYIELHFHFFVMLVFMALYQAWTPYLLAILYVAVHHGLVGVLWPQEVFNHTAALDAPWAWAAIHAFFVMSASAGSIISWRFNERAFGLTRLVLDSAAEGIFGLDRGRNITFMNTAAIRMLGLSSVDVIGQPITQIVLHTRADGTLYPSGESPLHMSLITGAASGVTDDVFGLADGTTLPVAFRSSPITERGNVAGVVVTFHDITQRKRSEEAVRKRAEQASNYQAVLLHMARTDNSDLDVTLKQITEATAKALSVGRVGIWWYNEDHSEIVCADVYQLGQNAHENGLRLQARQYPKYFTALEECRTIAADDACANPYTSEFADGYLKPLGIASMMDVPIRLHGEVIGIICHEHIGPVRVWTSEEQEFGASISHVVSLALEASERKRAESALAEQAIRDVLTNLYNRRYFNHRIREELARADRSQKPAAILLCDLDRFKAINDTQGHQTGDDVLKAVAKSLQESTRGTDLVFRWGGDEMVIILSEVSREGILVVAERIRRGIREVSQQMGVDLDVSIGVALYPEHAEDVDKLIHLADRALYIAKKGGDKVHIGTEEYRLDEKTIKAVFQPIVDVRSNNEVIGYEALSRDPQGKLSILDLFKRYQAIGQLKELKCICFRTQLKTAREVGLRRVFINIDFDVLSELELVPKPRGIEVILEISELEALHDVGNHLKVAKKWRKAGYKIAFDDFGAGFISLPFIAQLVPEYIKVDRSTILQAVASEQFRTFSKDLVQAIRNYSSEGIIAEGVETEKELQVVKGLGIHLVQGFLFGKPEEITR